MKFFHKRTFFHFFYHYLLFYEKILAFLPEKDYHNDIKIFEVLTMESAEQQNQEQQEQQHEQPLKNPHLPTPAQRDDWRMKTVLVDLATCLLAAILVSFSLFYFSNYNNFAPGGVTGLASIVGNFLHT